MAGNPGNQMAAAVDSEIASYRAMQEEIQKMRNDQQVLMGQQNENEMVKQARCNLFVFSFLIRLKIGYLTHNHLILSFFINHMCDFVACFSGP